MFTYNRNLLHRQWYSWKFAEDYIMFKSMADSSGNLKVPTAWYSHSWSQNCSYNWHINYDWWTYTNYVWTWWTWSSKCITIATWLTPNSEHIITIRTYDILNNYWWALAFWRYNSSIADRLKEIIVDSTFLWFAVSETSTWNYFRRSQYYWCTNLINAYEEYLPATVLDTWTYFRCDQYHDCVSLVTPWTESAPNSITEIKAHFREHQYDWCSSLTNSSVEVMPNTVTVIWDHFRWWQYRNCINITTAAAEVMPPNLVTIYEHFRCNQYEWCSNLVTLSDEVMPDTVTTIYTQFRLCQYRNCPKITRTAKEALSSSISSIQYHFRHQQYQWDTWITLVSWIQAPPASLNHNYCRYLQFDWALNTTTPATVYVYWPIVETEQWWNFWFTDAKISVVYVPLSLLEAYKNSTDNMRKNISDSKFVWY